MNDYNNNYKNKNKNNNIDENININTKIKKKTNKDFKFKFFTFLPFIFSLSNIPIYYYINNFNKGLIRTISKATHNKNLSQPEIFNNLDFTLYFILFSFILSLILYFILPSNFFKSKLNGFIYLNSVLIIPSIPIVYELNFIMGDLINNII